MKSNRINLKGYNIIALSSQLYLDVYKLNNAKINGIDFITDDKFKCAFTKTEKEAKALRDAYYK